MSSTVRPKLLPRGQLPIRHKQHLDYEYTARALKDGHDVFFSGIKRQTAHYAAKKLTKMLKEDVLALPSVANDGEAGYALTLRKSFNE
jgi:hypothetical protein